MADSGSEYGYDLSPEDEQVLSQLVDSIPQRAIDLRTCSTSDSRVHETIAPLPEADTVVAISANWTENGLLIDAAGHSSGTRVNDLIAGLGPSNAGPTVAEQDASLFPFMESTKPRSLPSIYPLAEVTYPNLSEVMDLQGPADIETSPAGMAGTEKQNAQQRNDNRSPLQRFRAFPRKPLTVTDLTAGAWCELQYFYTLTRLPGGKKTRTAAMKRGSKVHKELEDQVHTEVKIETTKKEDRLGLRMWNIIQGLRTLRDEGLTRELEVWGMVEDDLVNGVIDGLSYDCPDPEWEAQLRISQEEAALEASQRRITEFFPAGEKSAAKSLPEKWIWLTDVKTRGSHRLPGKAAVQPSKMQLFLYHRFLCDMAADRLDYNLVFRRYGLDPDAPFSDSFTAQIGSLYEEVFQDADHDEFSLEPGSSRQLDGEVGPFSSPLSPSLVRYTSLRELAHLLRSEVAITFPEGPDSIGPLVKVEYRSRDHVRDEDTAAVADGTEESAVAGRILGEHIFSVEDGALGRYLQETMGWWKGDRDPHGVAVEEAHKCRSCEFAEHCVWRKSLDEELLHRAREKMAAVTTFTRVEGDGNI